jgi:two-component system response regulator MtrA
VFEDGAQTPGPAVLLVEDGADLGRQIVESLTDAGFAVNWIRDGDVALTAPMSRYQLVILDLTLPGASGFEILQHIRREDIRVPVLILSGNKEEHDKVRALDLGADDYVTKPFWPKELVARVRARLRRPELRVADVIEIGEMSIDTTRRVTIVGRQPVDLTRTEFDLLLALAKRRGAPTTRAWLLAHVMGFESDATERTLDVHISRLRRKLGAAGPLLATVWGVGYRLGAET